MIPMWHRYSVMPLHNAVNLYREYEISTVYWM